MASNAMDVRCSAWQEMGLILRRPSQDSRFRPWETRLGSPALSPWAVGRMYSTHSQAQRWGERKTNRYGWCEKRMCFSSSPMVLWSCGWQDVEVSIDTCGSDFDTEIGVYTLSVEGDLDVLANNDDSPFCIGSDTQSRVVFSFEAGVQYFVVVVRWIKGWSECKGSWSGHGRKVWHGHYRTGSVHFNSESTTSISTFSLRHRYLLLPLHLLLSLRLLLRSHHSPRARY